MLTFSVLGALFWKLLQRRRTASLRELDARTLADIGVDASEISSIDAEARGLSRVTRLRIAAHGA
jgi:hypothetical protein